VDINFQGFQSGIPIGVYAILLVISIGLAWWAYKDIRSINPWFRFSLITLRSIAFLILIALLINPFFKVENSHLVKPHIQVLLDNTRSVSIQKGNYNGVDSYRKVLDGLNLSDSSDVSYSFHALGSNIQPVRPGTLTYDQSETNLYNAIALLNKQSENTDAAILISDGIYTTGRDPSYLAGQLSMPVFTVGVGDTSEVKDLIVKNVVTNKVGYTRTEHPVEVTVLNDGFMNHEFQVQIRSAGEIIESQNVKPEESKSTQTLNFKIPLKKEGLRQFEVFIPKQQDEWTDANNSKPFSIDVRNNRQRILHLAFDIHPDVKTVRSILESDQNIQLSHRTWMGQDHFLEGPLPSSSDTLDLIILQGFPQPSIPQSIKTKVAHLIKDQAVVFIATPLTRFSSAGQDIRSLYPIGITGSVTPLQVNVEPAVDQKDHPIMELPEVQYDRMPLLEAPVRNVGLNPGSETLFKANYRGTETNAPLVAVEQIGNHRRAQINAFGFYKLQLSSNQPVHQFIDKLIYNIATWTATKPDNSLLKIEPSQKSFNGNDVVQLNAFLKNESGQQESNASVNVSISGPDMDSRLYSMSNNGNGQYNLRIGTLPKGVYHFEATAQKGDRTIDTHEGEFSVSGTNVEFVNTTRNDALLSRIALSSGGEYYNYQNASNLMQDLNSRGLLNQQKEIDSELFYPYQHAFWFVMVIILLASEWFLRKYLALP